MKFCRPLAWLRHRPLWVGSKSGHDAGTLGEDKARVEAHTKVEEDRRHVQQAGPEAGFRIVAVLFHYLVKRRKFHFRP